MPTRPAAPATPVIAIAPPGEQPPGVPGFADWTDAAVSGLVPQAVWLAGWDAPQAATVARAVRASPHWAVPVWMAPGGEPTPLVDGHGSIADAAAAGQRAAALWRGWSLPAESLFLDEKVLAFLGLRDAAELVPVRDPGHPVLYRFPQVEALAPPGEDAAAALARLARRGLLEPSALVDRTRHCRRCGGARQHYFDVCPHCASMQIRKAASLHCFTCGHVAPEADFRGDAGGMVCPNCRTALRHIGVDYDRPLTQYACGQCHHAFVESAVRVRCLDCDLVADPGDLDVREVAALRLTLGGRDALRTGRFGQAFEALDAVDAVPIDYFRQMVDWALATRARHAELRFTVMRVRFREAGTWVAQVGAARAYAMLDEFARRLRELLRTSDIAARTGEDGLWLFLPYTDGAGLQVRIETLLSGLRADIGGEPAATAAAVQFVEPERGTALDAQGLMAALDRA